MNNTDAKYTSDWLRQFKGLENLTEDEAQSVIISLKSLQSTLMALDLNRLGTLEQKEIIKIQQAA
jgi:hypothetical protein